MYRTQQSPPMRLVRGKIRAGGGQRSRRVPRSVFFCTIVTSRARSRDRTPTSDPDRTHRTSWTSLRTFCSTYALLTHYLHVSLGPHSGLRLSPDTGPTPLHHPVYPSALLTLFVFTRLHPLPCTGLRLLSLLTGLRPDLLYGPAPLVYKSALLYARSLVLISR